MSSCDVISSPIRMLSCIQPRQRQTKSKTHRADARIWCTHWAFLRTGELTGCSGIHEILCDSHASASWSKDNKHDTGSISFIRAPVWAGSVVILCPTIVKIKVLQHRQRSKSPQRYPKRSLAGQTVAQWFSSSLWEPSLCVFFCKGNRCKYLHAVSGSS